MDYVAPPGLSFDSAEVFHVTFWTFSASPCNCCKKEFACNADGDTVRFMTSVKSFVGSRVFIMLVLTGLVSFSMPAQAQILIAPDLEVYTSQSTYAADSTSIVDNITFNGLTSSQSGFTQYPSLTVGGVSFTTPVSNDLFVVGPGYVNPNNSDSFNFPGDGTSTLFLQGSAPATLTATLPVNSSPLPGVTAVGTNIGTGFSAGTITATVTLAGNPTPIIYSFSSANASSAGLGFLGFTTTDGSVISSITFSDSTLDASGDADFALDNFTYGIASVAAPEPASIGLLAVGLLGLTLLRRRARSC